LFRDILDTLFIFETGTEKLTLQEFPHVLSNFLQFEFMVVKM